MSPSLAALCGALLFAGPSPAPVNQIQGDYIEARTADVYTGPCFSNAEVFITGNQAVAAWKVNRGSWDGVDLSGLCVAAAVQASTTLSEDKPELARSVIIVDQSATSDQKAALISLAKALAGDRLEKVAAVIPARLVLTVESHVMAGAEPMTGPPQDHGMPKAPKGFSWAASLASGLTRPP